MKPKTSIRIALALLFAGLFPAISQTQPMNPALKQLDLDGDLVLFINTDTLEPRVLGYIDTLADTIMDAMPDSAPPEQVAAIDSTVSKIKTGIEWSGLLSLKSYAMSMAPVDGTLNRVISVAQHAEADGSKPLWRICASAPAALKGIHYVPADAVYTANSTTSIDEAWKIVNEAVTTFCGPQQAAAFNQKIAMFEMILGTNVAAVTASLDNEILLSLQLSETNMVSIPQGASTLTIPEPNLLIGFKTKEPLLGNLLLEKLKLAQMPVTESVHGAHTLHTLNLPIPLPVPVQATLVMTEDYLLIGSTPAAVVAALDSQANRNGLVSTPLYKKLLAGAPEKTSAIEFMSPRFMQTYVEVIKQAVTAGQNPDASAMMEMMLGGYKNIYTGGYALKTPTGIYSRSHVDYGGAKPLEMVASAYIGMISAIAIPSFQKTRVNSQEMACLSNRRILDAAKEHWVLENGKSEGYAVTEADITEYINGGFSALQCPQGGTYTLNPAGTEPECSAHNSKNKTNLKQSGNRKRAMTTEAQAGCSTIHTAMRIHYAENGNLDGISKPGDLNILNPGDLDGTYFKDSSYSISVEGPKTYTIRAKGTGNAEGLSVVMKVVDGATSWEL